GIEAESVAVAGDFAVELLRVVGGGPQVLEQPGGYVDGASGVSSVPDVRDVVRVGVRTQVSQV
ncbi:hypothetical protein Dimus_013613, partial [Dionaea muscipula]